MRAESNDHAPDAAGVVAGVDPLAGLVQIGFGAAGLARLMRFVPRSVMIGFVKVEGLDERSTHFRARLSGRLGA